MIGLSWHLFSVVSQETQVNTQKKALVGFSA